MTFKFGYREAAIVVPVALLAIAMLFLPPYDRPPLESVQNGFRGTGMVQIYNPRTVAQSLEENKLPELALPPLVTTGPKAGDIYQNVQVLGDLSAAQFLRFMTAITAWVAPQQGCNYCHNGNQFANDDYYTKRVSRWMIAMTRDINTDWADHVAQAWRGDEYEGAGVTCYTCHRGNNVPLNVWNEDPELQVGAMGALRYRAGQNRPGENVALASLPSNPFSPHLREETEANPLSIRVQGSTALRDGTNRTSIKQTELTYALMIHLSESLGVNCTFCHNSRSWSSWEQSTPQRTTAWYGIQMVQALNSNYITPTGVALPAHRLGPLGDVSKVNCATCHQGVFKPLYGANMVADFPSLVAANTVDRETLEPGLASPEASMAIGAELKSTRAAPASETPAAAAPAAADAPATPAPSGEAPAPPAAVPAAPADEGAATTPDAPAAADTQAAVPDAATPADAAPAVSAEPEAAEAAAPAAEAAPATPAPAATATEAETTPSQ